PANKSTALATSHPTLTASQSGFTAADALTISLSASRAPGAAATTYCIPPSASGAALSNYTVTPVNGTFTIYKAAATVTAANNSKTYGTSDPTLTASQSGFTAADALTITLSATRASGEAATTYVITPSASGASPPVYTPA